ncbi:MAG: transporter substrate-binding domain-containing protein [Clostridia bacterium]|nr:transporter substrate-binding domain-containing protein [Clostridia bacterium]
MKKLIALIMTVLTAVACCFALTACGTKYVAKEIQSAEVEEYGYCIKKTASNHDTILKAINDVIAETDIDAAVTYYTQYSSGEETTVELSFPDLSNNTAGTLDIYTNSGFEPYEFIDSDGSTVIGVDMYLMSLVAEKLNMKMTIHDIDFNTIVGVIATKDNAIGAAGMTINAERAQSVDFSDPYFSSVQCIISTEEQAFTKISDLAGKTIGVQKGTTGWLMIDTAIKTGELKDSGASLVEYANGGLAFTAMKQGKCDVVVIDKLPAQKLVK